MLSGVHRNSSSIPLMGMALITCIYFLGAYLNGAAWLNNVIEIGLLSILGLLCIRFQPKWLLALLICSIPFAQGVDIPGLETKLAIPSEPLAVIFSAYTLYFLIGKKGVLDKYRNPILMLLLADLVWLLITTTTSTDVVVSMKRLAMRGNYYLLCFGFIYLLFQNKKWLLKPHLFYALGLVPVILLVLKQHSVYNFIPQVTFSISQPYYDDHTIYGAAVAAAVPSLFLLLVKRKVFLKGSWMVSIPIGLALLVLLIGLIMAFSRAAWLSMFVGLAFWVILKLSVTPRVFNTSLISLTVGLIVASGFIYDNLKRNDSVSNDGNITNHVTSVANVSTDASNLERINRWVCALRMFEDKPILGFGPGTYQFEYAKYQTREFTTYISTHEGDRGNAHSEYFTYLSETGLPGFLIFVALVLVTLSVGIKNNLETQGEVKLINMALLISLVTFFFHGLFNSFIDQDKMAIPVFTAMAGIAAIRQFHRIKNNEELTV